MIPLPYVISLIAIDNLLTYYQMKENEKILGDKTKHIEANPIARTLYSKLGNITWLIMFAVVSLSATLVYGYLDNFYKGLVVGMYMVVVIFHLDNIRIMKIVKNKGKKNELER